VIDWATAGVALLTFVILTRWKISELWLIAAAGAFGLLAG
jgi:hypothetical protein